MAKFKLEDRIRLKTSGKTGVIKSVFDADDWNIGEAEYGIDFDDGSGVITIVERVLEKIDGSGAPKCECGSRFSSFADIHSFWCRLYNGNN